MIDEKKIYAELFIATGCNHCPIVQTELNEQLKKGDIANLNITNIAVDNIKAGKLNVRSAPWFSLANKTSYMIFIGNYSPKEINQWIKKIKSQNGMQQYIEECLNTGQLSTLIQVIQSKPKIYSHIIAMFKNEETSIDIRIGLDALTESLSGTDILKLYSRDFLEIASSNNIRLQIDALHYIALMGDVNNKEFLQHKSKDKNNQIKEAAIDALDTLDTLDTLEDLTG